MENQISDKEFENNIRPSEFKQFNGQDDIIKNLKIFVQAAKIRSESLDH
ncbi:MAG: Holliday junction branch migration DNA helicase RuvB, partial [Bacteroidales bacterium]|nr:Holliday junction branch migration DNA helicase RuvB [Bacteroidales bacterium]